MVAQNMVRTYEANRVFRFVEGIWLHRKSRQIQIFVWKSHILHHTCAPCSELPSCISSMGLSMSRGSHFRAAERGLGI